jgi:hypothetical protein
LVGLSRYMVVTLTRCKCVPQLTPTDYLVKRRIENAYPASVALGKYTLNNLAPGVLDL